MSGVTILGGELKRRRLGAVPKGLEARPILARIKKSLFDILKNRISGATFLDLFSGSGSVGLEALSRGARQVVFVDSSPVSQKWIESTLAQIEASNPALFPRGESRFCRADVLKGLSWLNERFNLIFSGAPYKDLDRAPLHFVQPVIEIVERDRLLAPDGWLIAQHHKKEPFHTPRGWDFFRQEHYGDNVLSFFRNVDGR